MNLAPQDVALGLGIGVAVGALVGIERERKAQNDNKPAFGGIRTFPLIGLAGGLGALMADSLGVAALALPFLAVTALLVASYLRQPRSEEKPRLGMTSEVAALVVFCIGALPFVEAVGLDFRNRLILCCALGVVVMAALALREPLHKLAGKVSGEDMYATVRFALMAAVALPLLPDHDYGPYEVLNPFKIGLVVVLIAGISFFGYVAVRVLGPRKGIGITAIFGGLASSTAVTLSFSGRTKQQPEFIDAFALAIVLASTIMFPRLAVEISAVQMPLLARAAPSLGAMLGVGLIGCVVLWFLSGKKGAPGTAKSKKYHKAKEGEAPPAEESGEPRLNNPFSLKQALKLGLAYAVIRFVAAAAHDQFGSAGLFASSALAGLTDVDAITISVCRMFEKSAVQASDAVLAITLAALSNTLTKTGIAFFLGGRKLGLIVAAVLVPATIAGVIAALIMRGMG
ncbi:MAG: MgtC/SapB family protein [Planctomycetes bacterium]|nr:MgtC/SapB family protein [Planctomycetota bacterium]